MFKVLLQQLGLEYCGRIKGIPTFVAKTPKARRVIFGDGTLAFVLNHAIFYRSTYVMKNRKVRAHEREHIEQRRICGPILFELLYLMMHCLKGYDENPFEKAACDAEI